MSQPKQKTKKGPRKLPASFRELVQEQRASVLEGLQLFGDFPECGETNAVEIDWLHVLLTRLTDAAEASRLRSVDETKNRSLRRELAKIVATCEAWEQQLEKEAA